MCSGSDDFPCFVCFESQFWKKKKTYIKFTVAHVVYWMVKAEVLNVRFVPLAFQYYALQILETVIKTRWKILPRNQCEGKFSISSSTGWRYTHKKNNNNNKLFHFYCTVGRPPRSQVSLSSIIKCDSFWSLSYKCVKYMYY